MTVTETAKVAAKRDSLCIPPTERLPYTASVEAPGSFGRVLLGKFVGPAYVCECLLI